MALLLPFLQLGAEEILLGGPTISEFLAKNETSIEDDDSDHSDWLEIFNASNSTINLQGWHLTDDPDNPTKWTFPDLVMSAQEYQVIFASGKDRMASGAPLHTNFSLSASGEYLALVKPDGSTIVSEFSPEFPPQLDDVSYGFQGQTQRVGFFSEPTPGAENTTSPGLILQAPVFSEESQLLTSRPNLEISLPSNSLPGVEIRYTTDGSDPGRSSPLWNSSLRLLNSTRIKAAAFDPSGLYAPSAVVTRHFVKVAPDLNDFSSNLPIVVIDSFGKDVDGIGNTSAFFDAFSTFIDVDDNSGRSSVSGVPDFMGNSGIRVRGSSSAWLFPKKQYRFETRDQFGEDEDVSLFGMPADSDFVLYAPWADKTMMRNHIAYRQGEKMGGYSVRTHFFELFFNSSGGSVGMDDYQGIYVLVEKVKIAKDRLDLAKLGPEDSEGADITGGYLIRKDRIGGGDSSLTTSLEGVPLLFDEPGSPTSAQINYLRNYLDDFEAALHGPDFADPGIGFRAFIDEDSWIDQHLLTEGLRNADGFRLSTYYHKDRNGLLKAGPAWDFNLALGNASFNGAQSPTGWHHEEMDRTRFLPYYPWYSDLFRDAEFSLAYRDRYFQIRQTQWDTPTLMAEIDAVATELSSEATAREFARWPTLGTNTYANAPGYQNRLTYQSEVDALKTFLSERFEWMDSQFDPPPVFSIPGGEVMSGTELAISTAGPGVIHYTLDGSDPSANPSPPSIYESPLLLTHSAWVKARVRMPTGEWGALATARYHIGSLPVLAVSEIHYRPGASTDEEQAAGFARNDFEFLEILNPGSIALNLTSTKFVRGLDFTFGNLVLGPGERAVLVKNIEAFTFRYGDLPEVIIAGEFGGNLDNTGEILEIEDRDRRVLLSFKYNDASPWPASTNGDGPSLTLIHATLSPDDPSAWRRSLTDGGSPGASDGTIFSGDPGGDDNHNGIGNLLEYALGANPVNIEALDETSTAISYSGMPGADDVEIELQTTTTLGVDDWVTFISDPPLRSRNPDGTESTTFIVPRDEKLFVRLIVRRR
ncbi:CotH kinase family protein [Verrucomicrobiaceae bacterium 227]